MRSTSYFIELMIAGAGATVWLGLIIFSLFGLEWVPWEEATHAGVIIVLSPFVYVLGVIFDRIVDDLFDENFKENYRNKDFLPREDYFLARTKIYLTSEPLRDLLEYGKTRIRIVRAWAYNSFLISFFGFIFILASPHSPFSDFWTRLKMGGFIFLIFFSLSVLSFRVWRNLSVKEARFLKDQSKILDEWKKNEEKT